MSAIEKTFLALILLAGFFLALSIFTASIETLRDWLYRRRMKRNRSWRDMK